MIGARRTWGARNRGKYAPSKRSRANGELTRRGAVLLSQETGVQRKRKPSFWAPAKGVIDAKGGTPAAERERRKPVWPHEPRRKFPQKKKTTPVGGTDFKILKGPAWGTSPLFPMTGVTNDPAERKNAAKEGSAILKKTRGGGKMKGEARGTGLKQPAW